MRATQILNHAVAAEARKTATIFGSRKRSWEEIGNRAARLAGALRSLGVSADDNIAVLAMNCDCYIEIFFAAPWAGAAMAPLNIRWATAENVYALTDSRAPILLVDDSFAAQAEDLRRQVSTVRTLIYIGDKATPAGMLSYEALIAQSEPIEEVVRKDDDLYAIFYTGGTTAHPKGVAMSHRAIVYGAVCYLAMLPTIEDIVHMHVGGFFHFSGANATWYVTMSGGTHVILPKFEPLPVMQAIGEHGVTNSVLVPTMINMLMNHPDFGKYDLRSLQTCIYGGSPMPEAVMMRAMKQLPNCGYYQIYGMTETGGFATMLRWRDHIAEGEKSSRLRSAGQPAPGVEVRVVPPGGESARAGQVVRSDILMTGYLNNPDGTAAVLRDGWMHTGDAGYFDEDGFLYVADRVKDMIVSGGENVYSVEVERALFRHPAVSEAAVIGIPSEQWGESVHAVVVLRQGMSASADEVVAHCRTLIGGYKVPRSIEFRSEPLPTTPVGKVRKTGKNSCAPFEGQSDDGERRVCWMVTESRKRIDEGSGAGQAGSRLQRQGPRQKRRNRGRALQRQDVDESVRRNRRRGGPAPERGRQGNRGGGGIDRPGAGGGNHPHRARHGRRSRHPGEGRR
jgi:long-chain acyl-CoA synthetase